MVAANNDKALLILDLDETLIHSSSKELGRTCDLKVFDFFVYKRPHLDKFLVAVFSFYSVAIWSTRSDDYVDFLANEPPLIIRIELDEGSGGPAGLVCAVVGYSPCQSEHHSQTLPLIS